MGKFETVTSIITGGVMFISLALVFFVAIYRIVYPESIVHEGAYLGIVLMVIGVYHEHVPLEEERAAV